ncbi:hypothetical protein DNU06_12190 [Putridiphycobacter roseus]|uniref:Secretion system C-terminal sorting domain-containing protein n=1 Tax=Putridiphycobacter roseus TaxID=2219161 RepID=A0A2W1MXQ3_9FLAO|nr:T9SS type A sorting domain-containing protein [Putridiphycobacter roseus]PZE16607.1 hypothetical protein DNU06_12190 [Putridiphycobacter roseus]
MFVFIITRIQSSMKYILFVFSFLIYQNSICQFSIDLGNDTVFCPAYPDTATVSHQLGINTIFNQGTPPYSYSWYMAPYTFPGSSLVFHASTFLDDTATLTPNFLGGLDEMEFFLSVTDANNQIAKDSITIYYPKFTFGLPIQYESILLGDSILTGFVNVFGGIPPLTYLWRPNHGLLDSTNTDFWTKPLQTTAYHLTLTDSAGCKGTGGTAVIVYISSLSIENLIAEENNIVLYPNPSTGIIYINDEKQSTNSVQIFDAMGRFLVEMEPSNFQFDLSNFAKGTYLLQIETDENVISRRIILK